MRLLSLPEEVLDLALKYLLPSFLSQSLAETYVFAVPTDLLVVRLVSRRLHRIATPLAWRRVQLQITSPSVANYTDSAVLKVAAQISFRSLVRCRFLQERPELATHVRSLIISLEWHGENPALARDALRAATKAMSSLRTVLVWDTDVLAFRDIRQLLQKPLLHAISLIDVDGSTFPAECNLGTGLKMLRIVNSMCPGTLVAGAGASLECVSIDLAHSYRDGTRPAVTLRAMPWKHLKEVALVGCSNDADWFCFLDGFESHRRLGLHIALTELMIGDLGGLDSFHVNQLLHAFSGQPLTRLILYHIIKLDPQTVSCIVRAFPVLRHLTLLTDGELAPWPGPLEMYAQTIAGLPSLETLAWNNFYLNIALEAAFSSLGNDMLGTLYARHAHVLMRHVRHLRYIKLTSVADCIVDTVDVRRTNGRSRRRSISPVDVRRVTEATPYTSSWSTTSDAFQGI